VGQRRARRRPERSAGWFQRDTQLRLFFIGFLLAAAMNLNHIVVTQRLWTDAPIRAAFVDAAKGASKIYDAASAPAATTSALRPRQRRSPRWACAPGKASPKATKDRRAGNAQDVRRHPDQQRRRRTGSGRLHAPRRKPNARW
jgi:hypothetical protein